jgi:hypothetical protein
MYKKKSKLFFLIKIFFILYFTFLVGFWFERYEFDKRIALFSSNLIENISSKIHYSFTKKNKFYIDLKYSDYEKLGLSRLQMIKNFKASNEMQIEVPGKISFNDKKFDSYISIKGTHKDHWEDSKKWSFKIKLNNNDNINKKNEFTLQHPKVRGYFYEWLFLQFLKYENLISLDMDFYELIINGENLGMYAFTESEGAELLKSNNRENGPIIFFDKQSWIKETSNLNSLGANDYLDSFFKAPINIVNSADWINNDKKKSQVNKAVNLLNSFRNEKLIPSNVFDVDQLAKLLAIKAIFGAVEFDWKDIKFYYNADSGKLEPIGREVHVDINNINFEPKNWWISLDPKNFIASKDQKIFLEILFKDLVLYEKYIDYLYKFSEPDYVKNFIKLNNKSFKINLSKLKKFYPHVKVYSESKIIAQSKYIRDTLNPINNINVYFLREDNNWIYLNIENTQKLPVKIIKIELNNQNNINLYNERLIIKGNNDSPIKQEIVKIKCNLNNNCFEKNNKKQKIFFSFLGDDKIQEVKIFPWSNIKF